MNEMICNKPECAAIFTQIDLMIDRVCKFQTPKFQPELLERERHSPNFDLSDDELLKILATLIAYSQQAQAKVVGKLLASGLFDKIFEDFIVEKVALLRSDDIIERHWPDKSVPDKKDIIGAIRYPQKVASIIKCARILQKLRSEKSMSFAMYIQAHGIPTRITNENELVLFWRKFEALRKELEDQDMPFVKNFTTLCHLLKDFGYDCAKPDSAVMNAAIKLGIINAKKSFNDTDKKKVIQIMQIYGLCRQLRTPVLDLYFLIHGKQGGIMDLVMPGYFL